jgi:hypothetical protein
MSLMAYARHMEDALRRLRFNDDSEDRAGSDNFRCPDCEKPTGDGRLCPMCQADRTGPE